MHDVSIIRVWDHMDDNGRLNPRREVVESPRLQSAKSSDRFLIEYCDAEGNRNEEVISGSGRQAMRRAIDRGNELCGRMPAGKREKRWSTFVEQYRTIEYGRMKRSAIEQAENAFRHFDRITRPDSLAEITTDAIVSYIAQRRQEPGQRGAKISDETIAKELRQLKAAFNCAVRWNCMAECPGFPLRLSKGATGRVATFMPQAHFDAIYRACESATLPRGQGQWAANWWRGLLTLAWRTRWDMDEALKLLWADVDPDAGRATLPGSATKSRCPECMPLDAEVVGRLRLLRNYRTPEVFRWDASKNEIVKQFRRIQDEAGVETGCQADHEHDKACSYYGLSLSALWPL